MFSDSRNNVQRKDDRLNHSQNLTLSTGSTSHQLQHEQQQQQQQQQFAEKLKRKSRGNRKEQHRRRRLRRREEKINNNTHENHEMKPDKKRKHHASTNYETQMNKSLSQLSISQQTIKKKTKLTNTLSNNNISNGLNGDFHQKKQQQQNTKQPVNHLRKFVPRYLNVSDKVFKEMLSTTIKDGDKIVQSLDTNEKLQFVRQITEVTNNLQYINLQRQLWQDYYNIGMKEGGIWASKLSKIDAKQLHTCRTYVFPKHIIETRQKTIQHQLQRTTNELQQYLIKLEHNAQQWQPSINPDMLSNAINECVKKGQQRLRQEFDYKRKMLELNSNDHHLIKQFYDLRPNEEQIQLAKIIWETTANELQTQEYEEILRKRIYLRRLPSAIDKNINQSTDPIQLLLSNPIINKDKCASLISSCSKTVTQFKFDLMILNLNAIQDTTSGHQQLLVDRQEKLSQSSHWNESLKQVIKERQQIMRKIHEIYLKHKLNTFFDEAPMAATLNE